MIPMSRGLLAEVLLKTCDLVAAAAAAAAAAVAFVAVHRSSRGQETQRKVVGQGQVRLCLMQQSRMRPLER